MTTTTTSLLLNQINTRFAVKVRSWNLCTNVVYVASNRNIHIANVRTIPKFIQTVRLHGTGTGRVMLWASHYCLAPYRKTLRSRPDHGKYAKSCQNLLKLLLIFNQTGIDLYLSFMM